MTITIPRADWVSDDLAERRGEHAGFQMFTREGNDAVAAELTAVFAEVEAGAFPTRDGIVEAVSMAMRRVRATHPEVNDTEPEWAVTDLTNQVLMGRGYLPVSRDDLFS